VLVRCTYETVDASRLSCSSRGRRWTSPQTRLLPATCSECCDLPNVVATSAVMRARCIIFVRAVCGSHWHREHAVGAAACFLKPTLV
jgi:hypothetical protein